MSKFIKYILVTVGIVFVIYALLYAFVWRPADSNYVSAKANITSLRQSINSFKSSLSTLVYPGLINDKAVSNLNNITNQSQTFSKQLAANKAISNDLVVQAKYTFIKKDIDNFLQSEDKIVSSLKTYMGIVDSCGKFYEKLKQGPVDATLQNFTTIGGDCEQRVTKASTVPDQSFNTRYFSAYRKAIREVISSYRNWFSTNGSAAATKITTSVNTRATSAMESFSTTQLKFDLPTVPESELASLSSILNSQKSAFFR